MDHCKVGVSKILKGKIGYFKMISTAIGVFGNEAQGHNLVKYAAPFCLSAAQKIESFSNGIHHQ